ncbi:MAG TPA: undecaprenyl-diphosphate phosphatase [Candidatus Paceibacterota bacterium]|nr:undecaprenyl-diphosphate phosphatase [Candidatus Paceibacterota bacterium]
MLSLFQGIILGLAQGISELFPISSLGHTVLLPGLLGWHIDQNSETFLEFLVATHLATAIVLFVIYFKDWVRIVKGIFRSLAAREISDADPDAKLGWLLVVSTIPAGIIGLLLKDQITGWLLTPASASIFLALNGVLLLVAERLRKRAGHEAAPSAVESTENNDRRIAHRLTFWQATKVGLLQVLALLPGFSRTGSTLAGSLMVGLSHEDSLRYSFLLATPIIGAAALLEVPPLLTSGNSALIEVSLAGAIAAALAAWFAVKFLTRYFKTNTLTPFAIYCIAVGLISIAIFR